MFKEFPKALYKGGEWDGVSEPDCVTALSLEEQCEHAAEGYFPIGEKPAAPPDPQPPKRGPGRPRKEAE